MTDLLQIEELGREPGLAHAFSTLRSGEMARRRDEEPIATPARRAFLAQLGLDADRLSTVGAVHGVRLRQLDEPQGSVAGVDGLLTDRSGLPLFATFGDCCPILLYDPEHHAVALCHAGWRGTAGAIAAAGVLALRDAYGSRPQALRCGIGPAICGDCYEVGPEVASRFDGIGSRPGPADRAFLDVGEVNRRQLLAAGMAAERIHRHPACTREDARLPSHRRDHDGRRFAAVVALR
ncbi:MAG: polyphenol oxidase family protein [Candidatus Dormiibacterota bacterium]